MRRAAALVPFALALLAAAPASAGSLEVGPIRVLLIGQERTATLNVRNTGTSAMKVQVRTVDWTQPQGQDVYTPSTALLASPPLISLGPNESQVVRVVVDKAPAAGREAAYRLILDELPPSRSEAGAGVQTSLRVLVPVFVTPSTNSRPNLKWSAGRAGDKIVLTAQNDGAARDRLIGLKVSADGKPLGSDRLEGYVLSHSKRIWMLPATNAASLSVDGAGDYGPARANVSIGP